MEKGSKKYINKISKLMAKYKNRKIENMEYREKAKKCAEALVNSIDLESPEDLETLNNVYSFFVSTKKGK